ncbi:hypothetical protein M0R72_15000 [Candidatus Pacearchaeota archaeon]|jgi:hypothetical protein|nr:hypothetical protein [Candidatus Pacearchaeota archaeon]
MKLKILKSFNFGSVSDPQRMTAGNIVESSTIDGATDEMIEKWIGLRWVAPVGDFVKVI